MSQPVQELLRVQVQLGGDLAQLEELGAVHTLEYVNEVLHQPIVHGDAVQKDLEGVLAGVRVRLRRLGRSFRRGFRRLRTLQEDLKSAQIAALGDEQLLRQHRAVLRGAGADKGRHAHGLQLPAQSLDAGGLVAVLRQGDALRGGALALPHLGHVLQIIVKKGHSIPRFPTPYLIIRLLPMQGISGMMGKERGRRSCTMSMCWSAGTAVSTPE